MIFTCDFNFDLICGVIDPVFGTIAGAPAVPLPAPLAAAGSAFLILGAVARRRKKTAARA